MPVVGLLSSASVLPAFGQGLSESGYDRGRNVAIESRLAQGEYGLLPAMAADLVSREVAVIAANGLAAALAAKGATSEIPIVFSSGDPIAEGLVASLARPGSNLTGISLMDAELMSKRVELLSALVPQAKAVALLVNPSAAAAVDVIRRTQDAARSKRLELQIVKAGTDQEIEAAFTALGERRAAGVIVAPDPFFGSRNSYFPTLAMAHGVPAIYYWSAFAWAGGLISYGPSLETTARQLGIYAGKVLKGEKPASLPVQQPDKFELVINLKAAKALGLTVPRSLLLLADTVIE
jgi:ABC-type uncharacterized transport system substrate-binding protein